jgi:hypothetical protein
MICIPSYSKIEATVCTVKVQPSARQMQKHSLLYILYNRARQLFDREAKMQKDGDIRRIRTYAGKPQEISNLSP